MDYMLNGIISERIQLGQMMEIPTVRLLFFIVVVV